MNTPNHTPLTKLRNILLLCITTICPLLLLFYALYPVWYVITDLAATPVTERNNPGGFIYLFLLLIPIGLVPLIVLTSIPFWIMISTILGKKTAPKNIWTLILSDLFMFLTCIIAYSLDPSLLLFYTPHGTPVLPLLYILLHVILILVSIAAK